MYNFPEHIFKAYDIRGLADSEISTELAFRLGQSFVEFLKQKGFDASKKIVVARDMRGTSLDLQTELIRGLTSMGVDVVDIGLATTPLFNFACANYPEHVGGIMVTASHNPSEYNGFKITLENGLPVGKNNGMSGIRDMCLDFDFTTAEIKGQVEKKDILPDYEKKILSMVAVDDIKKIKMIIDSGNGMGQVTFPNLLEKVPIEVEYMYLEPDGNFPNHEANPLKTETLQDLQKRVVDNGADFGFALDGDADRIGLVDEKGQVVPASFVGLVLGLEIIEKHKDDNPLALYDLRSSKIVPEKWQEAGAKTQMCPVGHSNIKKMMKEGGAVYASELSLHLYYHDMYDLESPELSLLLILELLSKTGKKLSEIWQEYKKYYHSGEMNFKIEDKEKVLEDLKKKYSDAKIIDLDGLSFEYPDFWFNVRLSNTEPVLRLNLEASSEDLMREKISEVRAEIEN